MFLYLVPQYISVSRDTGLSQWFYTSEVFNVICSLSAFTIKLSLVSLSSVGGLCRMEHHKSLLFYMYIPPRTVIQFFISAFNPWIRAERENPLANLTKYNVLLQHTTYFSAIPCGRRAWSRCTCLCPSRAYSGSYLCRYVVYFYSQGLSQSYTGSNILEFPLHPRTHQPPL